MHHIKVVCGDGVEYLHQMEHADLIFIDPARRDQHGGRTYGIADCTPNVLEIVDEMLDKALDVLYTITWAYLNNREKIEEYERNREQDGCE